MKNADSPATGIQFDHIDNSGNRVIGQWRGLTKREHFAAVAMQGLLVNVERNGFSLGASQVLARAAKDMADELLKALEDK